jgi:hypothetical protein
MREVKQHADSITAYLEVVRAGSAIGGLSPTCTIYRESDGQYWDAGGIAWVGAPVANPMIAGPFTGTYKLTIPAPETTGADYVAGFPGYVVQVLEATRIITEHTHIVPIRDFTEEMLDNALSVYEALKRMLALRQDNMNILYTAWTTDGKPTDGTVWIYDSKAAADADTVPDGTGSTGEYPQVRQQYRPPASLTGPLVCRLMGSCTAGKRALRLMGSTLAPFRTMVGCWSQLRGHFRWIRESL